MEDDLLEVDPTTTGKEQPTTTTTATGPSATAPTANPAASAEDAEIEAMKNKVRELEEESEKIKEMSKQAEQFSSTTAAATTAAAAAAATTAANGQVVNKEEVDLRSIYVGNVHFACTKEEVSTYFQSCGAIVRVTIPADEFGQPKGFAYVEFAEKESVSTALLLNDTTLHGRQIKVIQKRTNMPGMSRGSMRGRRRFMMGSPYAMMGMGSPYAMMSPYGMGYGMSSPYQPRWRGASRGRGSAAPLPQS